MNGDLKRFVALLRKATADLDDPYFSLPIDGEDDPVYRERVYAYELYHQLRCKWPLSWGYVLNGEVDKRGHPLFQGAQIQDSKPDLLVHRPGDMDGNLFIIEIKPFNARPEDVEHDLRKLTTFCRVAGYRKGILLFFGRAEINHDLRGTCRHAVALAQNEVALDRLIVFWQSAPRKAAQRIPWD